MRAPGVGHHRAGVGAGTLDGQLRVDRAQDGHVGRLGRPEVPRQGGRRLQCDDQERKTERRSKRQVPRH